MTAQLPLVGLPSAAPPPVVPRDDRPAARLRFLGAAALSSVELLSLQIAAPDPLAVASRLVSEYGSVYAVTRAPAAELERSHGLGSASATRIRAPSPERYYHRVTAASLRRLARLISHARHTDSVDLEPWHTCLGWRAYLASATD